MRNTNFIASVLAVCIGSAEVFEAPLALAESLPPEHLTSGILSAEALDAKFSSIGILFPTPLPSGSNEPYSQAQTNHSTTRSQVQPSTYTASSKRSAKKRWRKRRYARRYYYYRSQSSVSRSVTAKPASSKPAVGGKPLASKTSSRSLTLSTTNTKKTVKKSVKRYSARYRKSVIARSRHRYARRSSVRPVRSSQQYARVSDAVRSVRSGIAQNWHETLKDVELMPGVRYKHYIISTGNKHSVHVLEVDRTKPEVGIALFKGQNLFNGLERLNDIATRTDSASNGILQGMINASFWKSASNMPLGPTVVNGEVLEMGQYKEWSACFFDRHNRMYIERFNISGMVKLKSITLDIDNINRRTSKDGVVLYNHFAGGSVPMQAPLQIEMLEGDRQVADVADELSDTQTNKAEFQRIAQEQQRSTQLEKNLRKAVVLYAGQPAVNEEVPCRVIEVDSGLVNVPQNGLVISFGDNIEDEDIPKPGDKIMVHFKTNVFSGVPFVQAVSGTPRLVNRGIARQEAEFEGARGERFITQKLPRTALGMDVTGTMLYFVAVEGTSSERGTSGMTMQQLAEGMKQLGAYHAMSLDGGASSSMVVRGGGMSENIGAQRKISVALGVIRQHPSERNLPPRRKLITKPVGTEESSTKSEMKQDSSHASPANGQGQLQQDKTGGTSNSSMGGGSERHDGTDSPSGKE